MKIDIKHLEPLVEEIFAASTHVTDWRGLRIAPPKPRSEARKQAMILALNTLQSLMGGVIDIEDKQTVYLRDGFK